MARLNLVAANPQKEIKIRTPKAQRPVVVNPSNDDIKDHFINKNGISYAGSHVIIDLWEATGLNERDRIEAQQETEGMKIAMKAQADKEQRDYAHEQAGFTTGMDMQKNQMMLANQREVAKIQAELRARQQTPKKDD